MKKLSEIINEELILERITSFIDDFKFSIDVIPHAEEREMRHSKDYITKKIILQYFFSRRRRIRAAPC